jgi:hypothetical protein
MTDESFDTRSDQGAKEKRSRRAVLAGALGVVAAEVALRAAPAEAADNVSKSKFTIHLNAAVPAAQTTKVAWFVVG